MTPAGRQWTIASLGPIFGCELGIWVVSGRRLIALGGPDGGRGSGFRVRRDVDGLTSGFAENASGNCVRNAAARYRRGTSSDNDSGFRVSERRGYVIFRATIIPRCSRLAAKYVN
ncbi:hypothetical protein Pla52n_61170 [Stieleria varia]|uniref:Uncharacterized protein n=1 Tax=Stieleria varia TaxID=2528005 RepID=A0A5C5ZYQ4_9BACT|nr:hypothetical protein Pla52n_61170 [Stieleria varia]